MISDLKHTTLINEERGKHWKLEHFIIFVRVFVTFWSHNANLPGFYVITVRHG